MRSAQICIIGYFIVYVIHGGGDGYGYPAFGTANTFELQWMAPILARNLIGTWLICGFWDWILYFSPLAKRFEPYKIVKEYPTID
jgi:hypothetical protein